MIASDTSLINITLETNMLGSKYVLTKIQSTYVSNDSLQIVWDSEANACMKDSVP